jgi:hypothetical protein
MPMICKTCGIHFTRGTSTLTHDCCNGCLDKGLIRANLQEQIEEHEAEIRQAQKNIERLKNKGRREDVSPSEVIEKAKEYGVKISRSTLLNYEKWGLIPPPVRGGAGRGKGRTTNYPDETPGILVTSYVLMREATRSAKSAAVFARMMKEKPPLARRQSR